MYVPLLKEFFDYVVVSDDRVIRTRVNNEIVVFKIQDVSTALWVNLSEGEKYDKEWESNADDADCLWKDRNKSLSRVPNLLEELEFSNTVMGKVILPNEGSRDHINHHARYALYNILKRGKVKPCISCLGLSAQLPRRATWKSALWFSDHRACRIERGCESLSC